MNLSKSCKLSLSLDLDCTIPMNLCIKHETFIGFGSIVPSQLMSRGPHANVVIGERYFISAHIFTLLRVTIDDERVVGTCLEVTKDVPSGPIIADNSATTIKSSIKARTYEQLDTCE